MSGSPPLRFLALAVGGWACARAAMLATPFWPAGVVEPVRAAIAKAARGPASPASSPPEGLPAGAPIVREPTASTAAGFTHAIAASARRAPRAPDAWRFAMIAGERVATPADPPATNPVLHPVLVPQPPGFVPHRSASRWAGSAWAFLRRGEGAALATGGTLGGSQMGARVSYRLNADPARAVALSGRFYAPTSNARAAEAALGVEWKPAAKLPVTFLAERRQALGRDGRSAFAAMAYGGVSDLPVPGGLKVDAYAQAGIVGLRSRDAFADGSARLSLPLDGAGRVKIGIGAWGAAQPEVARLDVGPQASIRLPMGGTSVTLAADWRIRVAGDAAPRSGPSLTLSTGF